MAFEKLTQDGFQHIDALVPADLLDRFEDEMNTLGTQGLQRKGLPVPDQDPFAALLATGGAFRTRLFANLKNMDIVQIMTREVRRKLHDMGFFDWAGLAVPLVYPSLRADPPGETTYLLPLHQDYATQCSKAWRLWIPLRDASSQTGTMSVVRGSHKLGYIPHDTTDPARPHVPSHMLTGLEQKKLTVSRGSAVLFNPLLVHASVPARENVMKYILLVQLQDLTTLADPDHSDDPLTQRLAMTAARDRKRVHN